MLKNNITVVTIGEPNLLDLPDSEKQVFLETIYSKILEMMDNNP